MCWSGAVDMVHTKVKNRLFHGSEWQHRIVW